ncbi:hypothetical protein NEUTE1DRAFT_116609 [Neurospora tetrasperma FGSC 2508]|uniref:Secreted protein n=1 Tax=Neurospora tetrasperma (strain FGSC 2508 / ATCC MYA-4615 / P0657) TaxID=510951 RepID=F8MHY0_NEUT8|nr:uncharacterized protein NEUTE1DRAFT_116609 [Neurospora tetrasperma FGSC 2508]EGO59688.1 hypothetical protein NEUTE1DRAFT_116609 [Neurospora tetrasperma FGSC 2508]EGZ73825.1 hypothetical protein NEUTE2DRAFT_144301 [Neurospora tetrasperma FGSC 2509]
MAILPSASTVAAVCFPLFCRIQLICATFITQCDATKHVQFMRYSPTLLCAQHGGSALTELAMVISSHRPFA